MGLSPQENSLSLLLNSRQTSSLHSPISQMRRLKQSSLTRTGAWQVAKPGHRAQFCSLPPWLGASQAAGPGGWVRSLPLQAPAQGTPHVPFPTVSEPPPPSGHHILQLVCHVTTEGGLDPPGQQGARPSPPAAELRNVPHTEPPPPPASVAPPPCPLSGHSMEVVKGWFLGGHRAQQRVTLSPCRRAWPTSMGSVPKRLGRPCGPFTCLAGGSASAFCVQKCPEQDTRQGGLSLAPQVRRAKLLHPPAQQLTRECFREQEGERLLTVNSSWAPHRM